MRERLRQLRRPERTPASGAPQPSLCDEEGVRAAYAAHGSEIYRFALRGLGDTGAAQDVVQETFVRAWRAADRYDASLSSLRTWLFAIARTTVIDHARASAVRPWDTDVRPVSVDAGASSRDEVDRLLDSWVVHEALQRITEEHRRAIVETHIKDRPHDEVAAELGIPIGTLRSRIFYGLKALRLAMDEMGETP